MLDFLATGFLTWSKRYAMMTAMQKRKKNPHAVAVGRDVGGPALAAWRAGLTAEQRQAHAVRAGRAGGTATAAKLTSTQASARGRHTAAGRMKSKALKTKGLRGGV